MANEITLETLLQANGTAAPQPPTAASLETVRTQVETLSPEQRSRVEQIRDGINLMDTQTAIVYGVGAQRDIAGFSEQILTKVRNKDSGYVGELMSDLVIKVKEVGVDELDDGFLDKIPFINNAARALKKFIQRYEKLEVQIDQIEHELEQARMAMLKDITVFDGLFEKNLEYFRDLQVYIVAGEEKLAELRDQTIPALRTEAQAKGDAMSAQVVRDFEDTVNRFEKKVHDLKLSKTIAIQTAPRSGSSRITTKSSSTKFRPPSSAPSHCGKARLSLLSASSVRKMCSSCNAASPILPTSCLRKTPSCSDKTAWTWRENRSAALSILRRSKKSTAISSRPSRKPSRFSVRGVKHGWTLNVSLPVLRINSNRHCSMR